MFLSFNTSMFTEEDGTTINYKDKKELLNFVTFKELWEKLLFLKIAAQAFEA